MKCLAAWESPVDGWVSYVDDDRPYANYSAVLSKLSKIEGYTTWVGNGHEYSDTYFDIFIFRPELGVEDGGAGFHVALSRFAPIGIFCSGRKTKRCASRPVLDTLYSVPDSSFQELASTIIDTLDAASIYRPTVQELVKDIDFDVPERFRANANLGCSIYFHILINDLY